MGQGTLNSRPSAAAMTADRRRGVAKSIGAGSAAARPDCAAVHTQTGGKMVGGVGGTGPCSVTAGRRRAIAGGSSCVPDRLKTREWLVFGARSLC